LVTTYHAYTKQLEERIKANYSVSTNRYCDHIKDGTLFQEALIYWFASRVLGELVLYAKNANHGGVLS
jgi:hypothetical protein